MKLITFTVPCYNSAAYMERCVDSLLFGGDEVEIILIDDGSTDETGAIADRYAEEYPDIVRVIHQENGGHGEGVNQGIRHAEGLFFKVVDSDDWLSEKSLARILDVMKEHLHHGWTVDMYVTNFVYEHMEEGYQRVVDYKGVFPEGEITTWGGIRGFLPSQYMMMHSVIYRTEILHECGVELPKHTFYVDNIMIYQPLPHVQKLCYLRENLYRYYIGRGDQSVNESVMVTRVDQQIRVTEILQDCYTYQQIKKLDRPLYRYMISFLSKIMCITSMFLLLAGGDENVKARDDLWERIKKKDPKLYRKLRIQAVGIACTLPGKAGRKASIFLYHVAQKIWKFN